MSAFFGKKLTFFVQKSTFTQSNSLRAVLEIFQFCFQFFQDKRLLLLKTQLLQTLCQESSLRTAPNWPKIQKRTMASQFLKWRQSQFFDVILFLLSGLVTGPSFMSISSLVLELWQFYFIRDRPKIWKSEILPSETFPISGDWGELWIPNLAPMSLIKCYWMLQNSRDTGFTFFELLREKQLGGGGGKITPPIQIRVKMLIAEFLP